MCMCGTNFSVRKKPSRVLIFFFHISRTHWTDNYGNNCSYLGSPYISNCGFDAAGSMLQHLYNNSLNKRSESPPAGEYIQFQQVRVVLCVVCVCLCL